MAEEPKEVLTDEEFEKELDKWEADYIDDCIWEDWFRDIGVKFI